MYYDVAPNVCLSESMDAVDYIQTVSAVYTEVTHWQRNLS